MSVVGVVELLAWLASAALALWMLVDMVRVSRTHDEASLVDAPDPLADDLADDAAAAGTDRGPA